MQLWPSITPRPDQHGDQGHSGGLCRQGRRSHPAALAMKNCASSLGLDLEAQKAIEIPDEDFGKDEDPDKRSQRPRSLEPFASNSVKS